MSRDKTTRTRDARPISGQTDTEAPVEPSGLRNTRNVTFVVKNVKNAKGFGLHVSSTDQTDGYGGRYAECHFLAGSVANPKENLIFLCYDGFLDASRAQNEFRINLGPKSNILQIEMTLLPTRVDLLATLLSKNQANDKRYTYPLNTTIPIREENGFWQSGKLFYSNNGVLNQRPGREGMDYHVSPPTVRPVVLQQLVTYFSENNIEDPSDDASPVIL